MEDQYGEHGFNRAVGEGELELPPPTGCTATPYMTLRPHRLSSIADFVHHYKRRGRVHAVGIVVNYYDHSMGLVSHAVIFYRPGGGASPCRGLYLCVKEVAGLLRSRTG